MTADGGAMRANEGKPRLDLIPPGIMADLAEFEGPWDGPGPDAPIAWHTVLRDLGEFSMKHEGRPAVQLMSALALMDNDGRVWADCANVFEYGLTKYAPWNWTRGQAWSKPIASALRHIVWGVMQGELDDPESGLPHRGHVACNIVMLLWFLTEYPEGDDR